MASTTRQWRLVRDRPDPLPDSVRRLRRQLRRQRPAGHTRWIVSGLSVVAVLATVWLLYGTSVFGVRAVQVRGAAIAGADHVRAVAAVAEGTPLARVDAQLLAERVRSIPSVASVTISRSWPTTLIIEVTERTAVAAVAVPGGYAHIDAAGVVFHTTTELPAGAVALKVVAPRPDDPTTRAALAVIAALSPQLRAALTQVVADGPDLIRLELAGGRVVVWGGAEQSDTKAAVATALLARPGATIDVSAPEVATVR